MRLKVNISIQPTLEDVIPLVIAAYVIMQLYFSSVRDSLGYWQQQPYVLSKARNKNRAGN
jgi:hypothetical protein